MTPHRIDYYEDPDPQSLSMRKLQDEESFGVQAHHGHCKSVPDLLAAVHEFTNEDLAFLFPGSLAELGKNDESVHS